MEKTRETITLSALYGNNLLYLAKFESPQPVRVALRIGGGAPILASANGKSVLAFRADAEIDRLLARPLCRFTRDTVTDARKIRSELRQIRVQGYTVDFGGYIAEVHAVGAPIRDSTGAVIASLGIVAPSGRFPLAKVKAFAALAKHAAARISESLGFSGKGSELRETA